MAIRPVRYAHPYRVLYLPVEVDTALAKYVQLLNDRGHRTEQCCIGSPKGRGYIVARTFPMRLLKLFDKYRCTGEMLGLYVLDRRLAVYGNRKKLLGAFREWERTL